MSMYCNSIVKKALTNLSVAIHDGGVEVDVSELPTVVASRVEMVQLFQNLIGNAVKYRDQSAPRIEIRTESLDDGWLLGATDTRRPGGWVAGY